MRKRRVTVAVAATVAGILTACGSGAEEPTARPSASSSSSTTTTAVAAAAAAPASSPEETACDRDEALAAIGASDAAEGSGHIDYLECLDGFGWALYGLDSLPGETAHVLLSITAEGYEVLNLGTSLCPLDSGMPADVALGDRAITGGRHRLPGDGLDRRRRCRGGRICPRRPGPSTLA